MEANSKNLNEWSILFLLELFITYEQRRASWLQTNFPQRDGIVETTTNEITVSLVR